MWSYGWKTTLTGKFFLLSTTYRESRTLEGWCSASGIPKIYHNARAVAAMADVASSILLSPHALMIDAGFRGDYAVVRFTAPIAGTYRVSGRFYAQDERANFPSIEVWILPDNSKTGAFSGKLQRGDGVTWVSVTSRDFQLRKGSNLDFQTGGSVSKNLNDAPIGLNALIERANSSAGGDSKKNLPLSHFLCNAGQKIPKE